MYIFMRTNNKPEIVKKANQSEELLIYFSRGIRIAKKLGNEYLINMAYQKNIYALIDKR